MGIVGLVLILGGAVWYYKAKAEIKSSENANLVIENTQLQTTVVTNQNQFETALKSLENERNRAVSRENLIRKKQLQVSHDKTANDNISADTGALLIELWNANQAANDNKTVYPAPR